MQNGKGRLVGDYLISLRVIKCDVEQWLERLIPNEILCMMRLEGDL